MEALCALCMLVLKGEDAILLNQFIETNLMIIEVSFICKRWCIFSSPVTFCLWFYAGKTKCSVSSFPFLVLCFQTNKITYNLTPETKYQVSFFSLVFDCLGDCVSWSFLCVNHAQVLNFYDIALLQLSEIRLHWGLPIEICVEESWLIQWHIFMLLTFLGVNWDSSFRFLQWNQLFRKHSLIWFLKRWAEKWHLSFLP